MNLASYVVLALVAVALFFVLRHLWRRRHSSCCESGCQGCSYNAACKIKELEKR